MSENERELYRTLHNVQQKYSYFMLTVAGAAIAFAVTQTQNAILTWSEVPLGLAVACWGGSFFAGCAYIRLVDTTLYANAAWLRAHRDGDAEAYVGIRQAMDSNKLRAVRWARWQSRSLVAGAMLYIAWHVLEMWIRTP